MGWYGAAVVFFILGIVCLPVWPYATQWFIYPTAFCWFLTILTAAVGFFSKRGGTLWRHKGQG